MKMNDHYYDLIAK